MNRKIEQEELIRGEKEKDQIMFHHEFLINTSGEIIKLAAIVSKDKDKEQAEKDKEDRSIE